MEKDYAEQLRDSVKAKRLKGHDRNVAAFLAVQDLVKERLAEGYSATAIFGFLRERQQIEFCYDTFLKYVHRYVQAPRKGPKAERPMP